MEEPAKVLALVKEVGVWRLGNFDGCVCSRFSLRNVDVDISCGKGGDRGVYIVSRSMDYGDQSEHDALLRPIAEEIQRQIEASDHRGPIPIYFRSER